jgi:hypothetical protein
MTRRIGLGLLATTCLRVFGQTAKRGREAAGTFDVEIVPLETKGEKLGRMSINKKYYGALEATSTGEMLVADGEVKESGVYVAVERVKGSLEGRRGSFSLHHSGVSNRGATTLSVQIVPDSGTDE